MRFEFATADRIVFGPGVADQLAQATLAFGNRVFLVLGSRADRFSSLLEQLASAQVACEVFRVAGEPTTETAEAAVMSARQAQSHAVIAIGGGSVIDTGKVVAAMLRNEGELLDYLEVVGKGRPLVHESAPFIAVPTTAGTGAEVTRNAVLGVPEHRVKVSMRSPLLLPALALVDPLLTHSMSPELTASTGLDALTQLIEPFVSIRANPLTDGFCPEGLLRAGRSLRNAFQDGSNAQAREDMALASLLGGLALANAGLGAVHGFAGPLGGMTNAPHGVICGKLLPHVIEINVRALQTRAPDSPALARFDEVGQILTGKSTARASDAVTWIQDLCEEFGLPGLSRYGLRPEDVPAVTAQARKASSMKGNPIELSDDELIEAIEKAL